MEPLHEIIIGLLTNAIWALGGFLIAFLIKKSTVTAVITPAVIKEVTYHRNPALFLL